MREALEAEEDVEREEEMKWKRQEDDSKGLNESTPWCLQSSGLYMPLKICELARLRNFMRNVYVTRVERVSLDIWRKVVASLFFCLVLN